ncbi:MAG TPA: hypothetical protein IAC24_02245, partial [Candidatus Onthousia faecigallinarum]|nr:hypothetical protein [Candidatus Onthousia faecigallinarum]
YRLRMYVDENYNPQGDGGGLTFSVRINVYGLAGEKYVPETTKTILAANPLQEEKENMFNYASNGTQYDPNDDIDYATDPDPEYVTNGLYSTEDEDGTSYYFRGAITTNNVQFGEYTSDYYVYDGYGVYYQSQESCLEDGNSTCTPVKLASAGDKMYWKIVRVNGDGSLRLIYNGISASPSNSELTSSYAVGIASYNLEANDPKYSGYTYDNGVDSFIKREVDTWYQNTLGKSNYDRMVTSGRFCSDSSGYQEGSAFGRGNVFASMIRLSQSLAGTSTANTPTLKCPSTSESYGGSYRLKVGLITADELAFAGEVERTLNDGYLNPGDNGDLYWSMTPAAFFTVNASVWSEFDSLYNNSVRNATAVRPVINVTTNNGFTSGDGTVENAYVIGVE